MAGGHQSENPNAFYMNGRGFWTYYVLLIVLFHIIMLSVPLDSFTVPWVWTVS